MIIQQGKLAEQKANLNKDEMVNMIPARRQPHLSSKDGELTDLDIDEAAGGWREEDCRAEREAGRPRREQPPHLHHRHNVEEKSLYDSRAPTPGQDEGQRAQLDRPT